MASLPRFEVPTVDYGSEEQAMVRYRADGERRATALGNRGPIGSTRRQARSAIPRPIRGAVLRLRGRAEDDELADIERDVADMLARAPVRAVLGRRKEADALGRLPAPNINWVNRCPTRWP
jgi:hypothetical protein